MPVLPIAGGGMTEHCWMRIFTSRVSSLFTSIPIESEYPFGYAPHSRGPMRNALLMRDGDASLRVKPENETSCLRRPFTWTLHKRCFQFSGIYPVCYLSSITPRFDFPK